MKLDWSKFKKISSDSKSTTMKHMNGHKIVIAHHALTPAEKKKLRELPGHYADGGLVEEVPEDAKISGKKFGIDEEKLQAIRQFDAPEDQLSLRAPAAISAPVSPTAQPNLPSNPVDLSAPVSSANSTGLSMLNSGIAQETAGKQAEANAIQQQGAMEAKSIKESIDFTKAVQQQFESNLKEIDAERASIFNDIKEKRIDPNRYMDSRTGTQKVATAIGLLLGGMGAGILHQENPVMKMLDQQIQRDIDAQKSELGKSQNLLSYNLQKLGNLKDATQMTLAMRKDILGNEILAASANAKGPLAQSQMQQYAGKLLREASDDYAKLAEKSALSQVSKSGAMTPVVAIQLKVPEPLRKDAMKELYDYKEVKAKLDQVGPVMRGAFKDTGIGENLSNPIQAKKRREVAYSQIFPIVKSIVGEKMSDAEAANMIQPYLPGFTTNAKTMEDNIRKLETQLSAMAASKTPILSEFGIVQPLQATPETKTMGGIKYVKVPGGWKKAD